MPVEIMRRFAAGAFRWILIVLLFALVTPPTAQARFLSPDTWDPWLQGVDINRYAYSNNDPINNSDPNGHGFEWLMDQANRDAIAASNYEHLMGIAAEHERNGDLAAAKEVRNLAEWLRQ